MKKRTEKQIKLFPDGAFGHWFNDENGLPAYEYDCDQDSEPCASYFTTKGPSRLHWHQFGNDRFNVIATNYGYVEAIESSRGLQWLNHRNPSRICPGGGITLVNDSTGMHSDLYEKGDVNRGYRRIFGSGYFRKISRLSQFLIDCRIIAPFGDDPVLLAEIIATNAGDTPADSSILSFFGINLKYMIFTPLCVSADRKHYAHNAIGKILMSAVSASGLTKAFDIEERRARFSDLFNFDSVFFDSNIATVIPSYSRLSRPSISAVSSRNYYPDPLFISVVHGEPDFFITDAKQLLDSECNFSNKPKRGSSDSLKHPCLCAGQNVSLDPGESERLVVLFGYGKRDAALELCEQYSNISDSSGDLLSYNADLWSPRLPAFSIPDIPDEEKWAARELTWHSCQTRGSLLYDDYYKNHYLPQGGAYEYVHGLRGAVRDLVLFNQALIYLSPRRASELLEYCLRMVSSEGEIKYAAHGYGCNAGAVVHSSPSDLQLFLLWAITDYVFFTRDFDFLDRVVPFYPRKSGESSALDRVKLSVDYIHNKIGIGEHGLIRVGDGDWSDGISFFVKDRAKFVKHGESSFNTAMALYVLPRVADLLDHFDPARAKILRETVASLMTAMLDCYNGKWFFRGFDGKGAPIGDSELFLEHHVWLLISGVLPDDISASVIKNIFDILDAPAAFGQFVLYPPKNALFNTFAKGWDVNGGVWFAINYLLAWGIGRKDPEKAWRVFRKNSMAMKATVDPDIWYGIWSGPDSYNADYAERPRETYFHIPTPTTDFPVMNLNLHAGFVASLIRLCGVEPSLSPAEPKPLLPFSFEIDAPTFKLASNKSGVRYEEKLHVDE